jgi:hypothetical protein
LNRRNDAGVGAYAVSGSLTATIIQNLTIAESLKGACLANISSTHTEATFFLRQQAQLSHFHWTRRYWIFFNRTDE